MIRKISILGGLEFLIGRECNYSLGIHVYPNISFFAQDHYIVKFYLADVPYIVRDLRIRGNKIVIDFPTQKQLLKAIENKKKKDKKINTKGRKAV